ncbi:unnamed protein product [Rotaria sordida]|uniref:Tc1-like transposase DDE domain-containing protein n=1 Tax=Rotaria sordida TaxID=392033 RepID=A0A818TZ73_9BILA|nr:unnamed protein product [Rotaria sordida]CAF3685686.1 unnamed protein product [Rotaria sordida]
MGKKSIGEYKRAQTVTLYDAGFTISGIARQLNISWACVKNAIIRYRDHAPWHTSNMVKGQIRKLKINMLEWPPNSPDLNVIEEIWGIIHKRLPLKSINTKEELQKRLQEEWDEISITLCQALVDCMPERIEKCLKAKGSHFT